jgi:hypothetical protein
MPRTMVEVPHGVKVPSCRRVCRTAPAKLAIELSLFGSRRLKKLYGRTHLPSINLYKINLRKRCSTV